MTPGVTIRRLQKDDLQNGFLATLGSLSPTGGLDNSKAVEIFEMIRSNNDHVILVAELGGRIVGCVTILVEQKFIHCGGRSSHLEDLAVDRENQRSGIGQMLVRGALQVSQEMGCYKTTLDCTVQNRPFFEKMGLRRHEKAMRYDHGSI